VPQGLHLGPIFFSPLQRTPCLAETDISFKIAFV
jgi:hypothetical protein